MQLTKLMSDDAILAELGRRLARRRLDMRITQADLARQAGVSKRTVERIEAGASAQMSSIVRLCRVLDLVPGLDGLVPRTGPRPMDMVRLKGRTRRRAPSASRSRQAPEPWAWEK